MTDWTQYAEDNGVSSTPAPTATASSTDWSQYAESPASAAPTPPVNSVTPSPQVSAAEAGGRGFANSASFGLGKWVNGIVGASLNRVDSNQGDIVSSITSSTPNTGAGFWADVTNSVEGQKAANAVAMSDHPVAYIAGALAPAAVGAGAVASGKAALTGLSTTFGGQVATGAAIGAEGGAAESTTGKQLVQNTATGAALGGTLGAAGAAIPAGISALLKSQGTKATVGALDDVIATAKGGSDTAKAAAVQRLKDMISDVNPRIKTASDADVIQHAQTLRHTIASPQDVFVDPKSVEAQAEQTSARAAANAHVAPSAGKFASDMLASSPVAAGLALGSHVGGVPGAVIGTAGAMMGAKGTGQLIKDTGQYAAMHYAGSPAAQNFMSNGRTLSPLALGSLSGDVAGNNQIGMSGMLGNYISNYWSNR